MIELTTRIDTFSTVKKTHWYALKRLGIETVHDLFYHFPNRYEDYASLMSITSLEEGSKATIEGVVSEITSERSWKKRLLITRATIEDASGSLRIIWFNQKFIESTVKIGESIRLSGKISRDKIGLIMQSPAFERADRAATHTGRLVPIYPETTGLTSKFLRWQIATLFQKIGPIPDPLPKDVLDSLHLPDLRSALAYIHFPKDEKQRLIAEKRFAFEEMFFLQLKSLSLKQTMHHGRAITLEQEDYRSIVEHFKTTLPFSLTKIGRAHV